jgi:hypothetical protein
MPEWCSFVKDHKAGNSRGLVLRKVSQNDAITKHIYGIIGDPSSCEGTYYHSITDISYLERLRMGRFIGRLRDPFPAWRGNAKERRPRQPRFLSLVDLLSRRGGKFILRGQNLISETVHLPLILSLVISNKYFDFGQTKLPCVWLQL